MNLVIAKYKEDLSWTKNLNPEIVVNIIDKDGPVENIGRESHSYLKFIVENYESLEGQYVFCQGDPFPHCKNFLSRINVECRLDFFEFGDQVLHNDIYGRPNHLVALQGDKIWKAIFPEDPIPDRLDFHCGAQFLVHSKVIKKRPKEFYEVCLRIHSVIFDAPWVFERIWNKIFQGESKTNKTFFTTGLAVGDCLISISNILGLESQYEDYGVIAVPNQNFFSLPDLNILLDNLRSNDIIYLDQITYYHLVNYFLDYLNMRPGGWERLVRELSYCSGVHYSKIWPTFPRIDYPIVKNKIKIPKTIDPPCEDYILFNPISYNSSSLDHHHPKWKEFLIEVCRAKIPVVFTSMKEVDTSFADCINLSGQTKSAIDDLNLAAKAKFVITTGNNMSIFCNCNEIPHIVLAQYNLRKSGGQAEIFRKWMTDKYNGIIDHYEGIQTFKMYLEFLLRDNGLTGIWNPS